MKILCAFDFSLQKLSPKTNLIKFFHKNNQKGQASKPGVVCQKSFSSEHYFFKKAGRCPEADGVLGPQGDFGLPTPRPLGEGGADPWARRLTLLSE